MTNTSRHLHGIALALAALAPATALGDQIDQQATQFGHRSMFFTDETEEKNLELAGALLTINNDLGVDFTDPNSHDALGEILNGQGLENFRLIFDRLATHWTAQLLPVSDGQWNLPQIDKPAERYARKHLDGFGPAKSHSGGSGSTTPTPDPGPVPLIITAIPEPATLALFALGSMMMLRRHRRPPPL